MKKIIFIIILVILILLAGYINYGKVTAPSTGLVGECPDEMIINKMPGTSPQSSYYIKDGVRKEITDYDAAWVSANCTVPTQEVF